jgi:hypothetical protein
MLACRLTTILPAITLAEALETTIIHRVAGRTGARTAVVTTRPCRAPHHTIAAVGLIGAARYPCREQCRGRTTASSCRMNGRSAAATCSKCCASPSRMASHLSNRSGALDLVTLAALAVWMSIPMGPHPPRSPCETRGVAPGGVPHLGRLGLPAANPYCNLRRSARHLRGGHIGLWALWCLAPNRVKLPSPAPPSSHRSGSSMDVTARERPPPWGPRQVTAFMGAVRRPPSSSRPLRSSAEAAAVTPPTRVPLISIKTR